MNAQFGICIAIFILMILGYMQNKVSKTVVALTAMVALVLTGCLEAKTALAGFSNSNTIVMATMFIVSEGLSRTQAVHKVSALVNKISKGSFSMILFGYVLITMLLSQISGSFLPCVTIWDSAVQKCSLRLVLYPLQPAQRFQSVEARQPLPSITDFWNPTEQRAISLVSGIR